MSCLAREFATYRYDHTGREVVTRFIRFDPVERTGEAYYAHTAPDNRLGKRCPWDPLVIHGYYELGERLFAWITDGEHIKNEWPEAEVCDASCRYAPKPTPAVLP